jgi:hypothetical protein
MSLNTEQTLDSNIYPSGKKLELTLKLNKLINLIIKMNHLSINNFIILNEIDKMELILMYESTFIGIPPLLDFKSEEYKLLIKSKLYETFKELQNI